MKKDKKLDSEFANIVLVVVTFIMIVCLVLLFKDNYDKKLEPETTVTTTTNSTTIEETTTTSTTTTTFEEETTTTTAIKDDVDERANDIVKRLQKKGFKTSTKCNLRQGKNERCFSDGKLLAVVEMDYPFITFEKTVSTKKLKKYDITKDLNILLYVFGQDNWKSLIPSINGMIRLFPTHTDNINIENKNIYVRIRYYNGKLEFDGSYLSEGAEELVPQQIDTMLDYSGDYTKEIKQIYEMYKNNSKYYKFFDYYEHHLEHARNDVCEINLYDPSYELKTEYCGGGSGNVFVYFNKYESQKEDHTVLLELKEKYFEFNYTDILKDDLDYFSKKTKIEFNLSDILLDQIKDFIYDTKTKEDDITIRINDNLMINIKHSPDLNYPDLSRYDIEYNFYDLD